MFLKRIVGINLGSVVGGVIQFVLRSRRRHVVISNPSKSVVDREESETWRVYQDRIHSRWCNIAEGKIVQKYRNVLIS